MSEQVDRKPAKFKKFKQRQTPDIPNTNPPIETISFVDKLKSLVESSEPISANKSNPEDQKIKLFTGPKIINWSNETGRFAVAENILKQNEAEFIQMRQRMQTMADADGCGGINERNANTSGISNSNTIDFSQARLSKIFGRSEHNHKSGEHEHCSHGNDYGECPNGCKKAA